MVTSIGVRGYRYERHRRAIVEIIDNIEKGGLNRTGFGGGSNS